MSETICPICGNKMVVRDNSKNIRIIDGVVAHKKCPKPKMTEQESYEYKLLTDRIKYYIVSKPSDKGRKTGYNWANITNKIKQLKQQGYTYMDMLYTLEEVIKIQGCFWGFGAVVNNIDSIMYRKREAEKIVDKPKQEQIINLKVIEDDINW
jgi:hypothetical protein